MSREEDEDKPPRPGRTVVKRELRRVARAFADELFDTLDELGVFETDIKPSSKPTRVRRSDHKLDEVSARILAMMNHYGEALAISDIAAGLELSKRDIAHPIAMLVAAEKLIQLGERRGVRYMANTKATAKRSKAKPRAGGLQKPSSKKTHTKKRRR